MTFVEAAIEVLKREGKPLTTRRLAELAVKHNLLSVVGRDPEATMQQRLDDALEHSVRHPDLVRVKDDTFGLHAYPPRPYPGSGNGTQVHEAGEGQAAVAAEATPAEGEPKKERRRRRRGRRGEEGGAAAEAPEAAEATEAAEASEAGAAADEGGGETAEAAGPGDAAEAGGEGEAAEGDGEAAAGDKRRRRRRGGRGRRRREAEATTSPRDPSSGQTGGAPQPGGDGDAGVQALAEETPPIPDELPSEAQAAGTPTAEVMEPDATHEEGEGEGEEGAEAAAAGDEGDEGDLLDEEVEEIDEHTGPLLAPAFGAEDVTRTDEDRTVRPEIRGSRDDRRDRHRHHKGGGRERHRERDKGHEHKAHEHKAQEHKAPEHRAHEHKPHEHKAHEHKAHEHKPHEHKAHEHKAHEHIPEPRVAETLPAGLLGALLELLRASDGRPMHVRHLVDNAIKKKVVDDKTAPNEIVRLARAALVRETRDRELEGLRPRVRALGGGHYGLVDKKLDPELVQAERDLGDRAVRLRDATRAAVRRRLGRMVPAAFDALGRTLCDKLGITGLELLRRGEGVTYWGGTRPAGVATVRTLVALRPGEGEVNRRAVGELRAGLAAKGYDEGLLLSAGRPNAEALAELKQGGVTLYDGAALAALLIKHGLGVRRVALPVDYLDLDFFSELSEG